MLKKVKIVIGSVMIGVFNGLFGSGGGILAVKYLEKNFKDIKKAHASSLVVILPISIVSIIIYFFKNNINVIEVIPYMIGGAFGCFVGTYLLKRIDKNILSGVFSVIIIYLSVRLWFN